jgi:hypothetical protein
MAIDSHEKLKVLQTKPTPQATNRQVTILEVKNRKITFPQKKNSNRGRFSQKAPEMHQLF